MPKWNDPASVNFDELLADVERNPLKRPTLDPDNSLEIELKQHTSGSATYEVRVTDPLIERFADMSDNELITRCDNHTADLSEPMGKSCHFGGVVERMGPHVAEVKVWID